jgi:hypothetical protein
MFEVYLKLKGDADPKLYEEYLTLEAAKAAVETILLTTKNIKRLFIAHIVADKWEEYTGKVNLMAR